MPGIEQGARIYIVREKTTTSLPCISAVLGHIHGPLSGGRVVTGQKISCLLMEKHGSRYDTRLRFLYASLCSKQRLLLPAATTIMGHVQRSPKIGHPACLLIAEFNLCLSSTHRHPPT